MIASAVGSIVGMVAAVPREVFTNAECPHPEAADEAEEITGVHERHWVGHDQTARSLCTDAARRLMAGLNWKGEDIDMLVFVTQTPESAVPADVYRIAADLGAPARCVCLQVNWSCSGYVAGLWTTMRLLSGQQRALLLVGDATSTISDPDARATKPLFGDAGSATAVVGSWIDQHFVLGSDGTGADKLAQTPGGFLTMDGGAVFNFTLRRVPAMLAEVLRLGRPDFLCFHQANRFMLEHLVKKTKLLEDFEPHQIPTNIARFGNTSCASIPLLICSELAGRVLSRPARLALLGFGAGWAWAGASIGLEAPLSVCEVIES